MLIRWKRWQGGSEVPGKRKQGKQGEGLAHHAQEASNDGKNKETPGQASCRTIRPQLPHRPGIWTCAPTRVIPSLPVHTNILGGVQRLLPANLGLSILFSQGWSSGKPFSPAEIFRSLSPRQHCHNHPNPHLFLWRCPSSISRNVAFYAPIYLQCRELWILFASLGQRLPVCNPTYQVAKPRCKMQAATARV